MDCTRTSFRPPFASSSLTKDTLLYAGTSGEGRKRSFLPSSGVRYTISSYLGLLSARHHNNHSVSESSLVSAATQLLRCGSCVCSSCVCSHAVRRLGLKLSPARHLNQARAAYARGRRRACQLTELVEHPAPHRVAAPIRLAPHAHLRTAARRGRPRGDRGRLDPCLPQRQPLLRQHLQGPDDRHIRGWRRGARSNRPGPHGCFVAVI